MKTIWAIILITIFLFFTLYSGAKADGTLFQEKLEFQGVRNSYLGQGNKDISDQLRLIRDALEQIADNKDMPWEAIVALLLGLAGIFGVHEIIKNWRLKPDIKVSIKLEPPDSLKIAMTNTATGQFLYDTYYFRFKVENTGNLKMEDVEVLALELHKKGNNGRFSKVRNFLPMNLVWANVHEVTMPKIQPGLFKHCDFGHIVQNVNSSPFGLAGRSSVIFILETQVTPNTGFNYLLPGEYKIRLAFAANNLKPEYYWYQFKVEDRWDNNEQRMLSQNISIKKLSGAV